MRYLILVLLLLEAVPVRADDSSNPPIQAIPPGDDEIVAVRKGAPAPYDGQLFSPATALRWANWISQYESRLVLDVKREKQLCAVHIDHSDQLRDIEEERNAKVENDLRSRLIRSEKRNTTLQDNINNPSFWNSLEFGVILGVVGSAAVAVAVGLAAAN